MKRNNVFWAGLLLAAGLGIFFFMGNKTAPSPGKEFPWSKDRKDALVSMESQNLSEANSEKYTLTLEGGVWSVSKPQWYQTLPEKSAALANAFMNLKPKDILTNVSAEEYNAYGFTSPRLRFTAKIKGGVDHTLLFGGETSLGENIYVALENNKNAVYILPYGDAEIFLRGLSGLINNSILIENGDNVSELRFRSLRGDGWIFNKTNGFWVQDSTMATNKDWGIRRFLLVAKDISFETTDISYQVSTDAALALGIDTNTAPGVRFSYMDGKSSSFYLGAKTNNLYPVYIPEMKMAAWMQAGMVHEIFFTQLKDLEIKKK